MYAGTFSKVLRPASGRLLHRASAVCQKMIVCKQGEDVHTNILAQMIANEFMTKYDYPAISSSCGTCTGKKQNSPWI